MLSGGQIRTVVGAVLCGAGATCGLSLSSTLGGTAWAVAAILMILGIAVVAMPMQRRAR